MSTNELDEAKAVGEVVDRLAERFPDIDRARIAEVVESEHRSLDGKPVRDYVPVLVEHGARERLRNELASA